MTESLKIMKIEEALTNTIIIDITMMIEEIKEITIRIIEISMIKGLIMKTQAILIENSTTKVINLIEEMNNKERNTLLESSLEVETAASSIIALLETEIVTKLNKAARLS